MIVVERQCEPNVQWINLDVSQCVLIGRKWQYRHSRAETRGFRVALEL